MGDAPVEEGVAEEWLCVDANCQAINKADVTVCTTCFLAKSGYRPRRARSTCQHCNHKHHSSRPCHCFVVDTKADEARRVKWSKVKKKNKVLGLALIGVKGGGGGSDADTVLGSSEEGSESDKASESNDGSSSGDSEEDSKEDSKEDEEDEDDEEDSAEGAMVEKGKDNGSDDEDDDDDDDDDSSASSSSPSEDDDEEDDVFAESEDDDDSSGGGEEEDDGSFEVDGSGSGSQGTGASSMKGKLLNFGKKALQKGKELATEGVALAKTVVGQRRKNFKTEKWASAACLRRCNCPVGVPDDNPSYLPVLDPRSVKILGPDGTEIELGIRVDVPGEYDFEMENRPWVKVTPPPVECLRVVLSFLPARPIAQCSRVCRDWHEEVFAVHEEEGYALHPYFTDVHFMAEASRVEAHDGKVDSLLYYQPPLGSSGFLFTSGQQRVKVWHWEEPVPLPVPTGDEEDAPEPTPEELEASLGHWRFVHLALRDTAPITAISMANGSIFSTGSNGSIREYALAFNPRNIQYRAQMWEHNTFVRGACFSVQSTGYCKPHSTPAHRCFMYTASDDRSLKVWDMASHTCSATVRPVIPHHGTLQAVACSDFHLYAGSSNGHIYVYPVHAVCHREDRHECHMHLEPLPFCLQEELRHGKVPINCMACGGPHGTFRYMFSGSRDGSVVVWNVPTKGRFGHTQVVRITAHSMSITSLYLSPSHLYSACDGAELRMWSLSTLGLQRVFRAPCRIKCLWLHHPADTAELGSDQLFLGLADGQVVVYQTGRTT